MRIWKQILDIVDRQEITVPIGAKFLTVQLQQDHLAIWFECNEANPKQEVVIAIYGTGNPMPHEPGKYIGTFQLDNGELVFHVYDLYGNVPLNMDV